MSFYSEFKDFLEIHKGERRGLFVLALLMVLIIVFLNLIPSIFKPDFESNKAELLQSVEEHREQERLHLLAKESEKKQSASKRNTSSWQNKKKSTSYKTATELFEFDPNTATAEQWKKLGLNTGQSKTIANYLSKGGKFFKPEDLEKIYTISKEKYTELKPYIKIEKKQKNHPSWKQKSEVELPNLSDKSEKTEITPLFLDINTVDTTALKKLKGIGTFYAKKIVEQREKLGGYYSKEQLLELWNFKPEMLAEIKDQIHLGKNSINQINLNICEAKDLAYHPYLNWKQANAIIAYRNQHGNFQTVQEIQKSHLISSEICQRIAPYLTVE